MRKRQQRHDIIRDIIREHNVKTQRDLANQLRRPLLRMHITTISRDIMDMGLVKSREGYYVLPEEMRLQRMVSELVEEVHVAGNMVVVKTFSGGAAGVSAALDKASLRGALGTVAGDNTIMIAAESLRLRRSRARHRPTATTLVVDYISWRGRFSPCTHPHA